MRIRDWSSDVCSSDLLYTLPTPTARDGKDTGDLSRVPENSLLPRVIWNMDGFGKYQKAVARHALLLDREPPSPTDDQRRLRSEERRVGQECVSPCRYWSSPNTSKLNTTKQAHT